MQALRMGYATVRDLMEGQLTLRAMSLVYTTLLSLVPLLAISFSILKGFGVHNQVEPVLLNLLEPLGDRSAEITSQIVDFVDNVQVGVLGTVGFLLLFYTAVSLMRKIELAFNETWQVTRERSIAERFRDYFSVILLGPVLMFASLGISASLMSSTVAEWVLGFQPLGALAEFLSRFAPLAMIVFAFTFINMFVPNTRVRFLSAFLGGVASGVLWHALGFLFANFVAGAGRYTAIYSGFATPIFFMIWLYLGWLILLIGGTLSFYHQHPEYRAGRRQGRGLSHLDRVALLLRAVRQVGKAYYQGEPAPGTQQMARALQIPADVVDELMGLLQRARLVANTQAPEEGFVPGCPWEQATLHDVLEALRHEGRRERWQVSFADTPVDQVLSRLRELSRSAFGDCSLKTFVTEDAVIATEEADRRRVARIAADEAAGGG